MEEQRGGFEIEICKKAKDGVSLPPLQLMWVAK